MRERRIIIYIAAKAGQGQSAVDVLEGTKQWWRCTNNEAGGPSLGEGGWATWGWHCNVM